MCLVVLGPARIHTRQIFFTAALEHRHRRPTKSILQAEERDGGRGAPTSSSSSSSGLREEFRGRVNDTGESGGHVGVLIEPRAGPVLVPGKEGRKGGRVEVNVCG